MNFGIKSLAMAFAKYNLLIFPSPFSVERIKGVLASSIRIESISSITQ
jgi:hypothetical protein